MSKKIAIIPARGGSKRIPGKNIKDFLGKPIIAYSIETALNSKLFDEVMVSTDDEIISAIAKKYGANIPFMRSPKNSDDHATTADVLVEVLDLYKNKFGKEFESGCCIYPTAPLIQTAHLKEGLKLLQEKEMYTVFPAVPFGYPVWRGLEMKEDGLAKMLWPEHVNARSQDLKKVYHDAGQWYWFDSKAMLLEQKLFTDKSTCIILDETVVQDIDNPVDMQLAELKYQLLKRNKS